MIAPVPIRVECHCGSRDEEYPIAMFVEDERQEVTEVLDRWYEGALDPGSGAVRYFKVRTAEGALLILKHDAPGHAWYLMCEL